MPEPKPIKNGCLQGGNVNAYGGREEIRRMLMRARPEEFGPVVDAYKTTSELLTSAITALGDSAGRLVADGNWGGESARAMLTRMNRLQTYLQSLRNDVNGVPPALETVSRELASAKERFDKATELQEYWVEASGMGAGSMQAANDPDQDARTFMQQLNGHYQGAYTTMPDRLAWDAKLASPEPYLPPPERAPTPVQGGDLPYEDTVPVRSGTGLASTSNYQPTPAGSLPGTTPAAAPPPTAPPGGGGSVPPTPAPAAPIPVAPVPAGSGRLSGAAPGTGQPATRPPGTTGTNATAPPGTPPAGQPGVPLPTSAPAPIRSDPVVPANQSTSPAATGTGRDPYTSAAQEARSLGPTVRPGSVPVVDGSWPATRSPMAGGEPGAMGAGGMPFMPMGGGGAQEGRSGDRRALTAKNRDDDFFQPVIDCGPPVVG
ncbi:hypothetical protein [Nonomuraea sp. NPDC050643]|uniref:hypothetical protein n=1 Tax=Nonomuraea sp. NPDC050643 TaxID=3155660 RepID=UPI0033F13BDD